MAGVYVSDRSWKNWAWMRMNYRDQDSITEMLRNAIFENGYVQLLDMTPADVALDMVAFAADFDERDIETVTPLIKVAQKTIRAEIACGKIESD